MFYSRVMAVAAHLSFSNVSVCDIKQGTFPFAGPLPSPSMVASRPSLASLGQLRFCNPLFCRAGEIHNHLSVWEHLLAGRSSSPVDLMEIIRDGVKIERFFKPFKGDFKGSSFNSPRPTPIQLDNAKACEQFRDFISDTIIDWVAAGVLAVWGTVGEVPPLPRLVLPLTVEPSKPRLCHDDRFLNLWIKDLPFKLDHLPDLPRYALPGHFQTSFDDKSGYHHVLLHSSSRTFFGFQWNEVYFVFCTLPFGWKASAFIYHNLGLAVTSAARLLGIPVSQYIDDRHVGQLFRSPISSSIPPSRVLAEAAAYIICYLLIDAGYFIGIGKSQWLPSTLIRFLGLLCDSAGQAFLLPEDKRRRFGPLIALVLKPFGDLQGR